MGGSANSPDPVGPAVVHLSLVMVTDRSSEFFPFFQQGVGVAALVGCSLDRLLVHQWGLSREYVARRITTVFLDGRAIDNLESAIVKEGSTVALSAAMPGLVGATMRRGSYYAAMRGTITHSESGCGDRNRFATVRLKLFNLLLAELGPAFLRCGILLGAAETANFLRERGDSFWSDCVSAVLDEAPLPPERLREGDAFPAAGTVYLSVIVLEEGRDLHGEAILSRVRA